MQQLKDLSAYTKVIYRPHPVESVHKVKEYFSGSNVIIEREGSALN